MKQQDDVSETEPGADSGAAQRSDGGQAHEFVGAGARRVLKDISPRAWEHPADQAALAALRRVPGLDVLLRKLIGFIGERSIRYLYLANAVRVDENQFPELYGVYRECLDVFAFGDDEIPELYVTQTPIVNAGAVGVDRPFIVLNSGTLDLLDNDELRYVIGHEIGNILSDHVLYKTMLSLMLQVSISRFGIPFGGIAIAGLIAALREWDRKSELSADRAGLLCVQNARVAYTVNMKMAGGRHAGQMNVDAFVEQAEDYGRGGDILDKVIKLANLLRHSHPFAVIRVAELKGWVDSGDYQTVLSGTYPTRSEDDDTKIYDELKGGANSYREPVATAAQPVAQFFTDVGASAAGKARDLFRKRE